LIIKQKSIRYSSEPTEIVQGGDGRLWLYQRLAKSEIQATQTDYKTSKELYNIMLQFEETEDAKL